MFMRFEDGAIGHLLYSNGRPTTSSWHMIVIMIMGTVWVCRKKKKRWISKGEIATTRASMRKEDAGDEGEEEKDDDDKEGKNSEKEKGDKKKKKRKMRGREQLRDDGGR